ncbi:MAG: hypothetical protein CVV25_02845 [Ignavibacteriae bacterium HGW-Ignavibacteriae-4]|jgi:hypothetical protein|nr:MAG: hypothetical protein CVV25_02845 [Ignavibacteriae bacterium HGW-Ignavibacteriae-4]
MSEFEKINSFVEGELDASQEQELFNEMATNEVMRGEFKNLLAISAAVKNNRNAFTKNKKSKKAVFAMLGLSIPVADAVTGGVVTTAAGAAVGYGFKSLLATGVLSAVVTAVILWGMGTSDTNEIRNVNTAHFSPRLVVEIPRETPMVSSKEVIVYKEDKKYKAMYERAMIVNNSLQQQISGFAAKTEEKDAIISRQSAEISTLKYEVRTLQGNLTMNNANYQDLNQKQKESEKLYSELGATNLQLKEQISSMKIDNNIEPMLLQLKNGASSWSAEWKGSQTFNTNSYELNKTDLSQFNNNSLSIIYNFENGFSVGSELRQETFLLEFNGKDVNDINFLYRQEPNFTTLSFLGRYTYDMSATIDPFAQFTVGGNKIGVVGRLMGGFMYSPYQNLNMILGLEYNNMSFQYQGVRFNSDKIGINYGISVQF